MTLQGELALALSESECVKLWAFCLEPYLIFSPIWLLPPGVVASHLRLLPARQLTPHCLSLYGYISFVRLQPSDSGFTFKKIRLAPSLYSLHAGFRFSYSPLRRSSTVADIKPLPPALPQVFSSVSRNNTIWILSQLDFVFVLSMRIALEIVLQQFQPACTALSIDLDSWPAMFNSRNNLQLYANRRNGLFLLSLSPTVKRCTFVSMHGLQLCFQEAGEPERSY